MILETLQLDILSFTSGNIFNCPLKMERKKVMTSKSPTMDFDKVSASYGEESKTYLDYNRLFGNKLRFEDFDEAKLAEEDDPHIDSSTSSSSVACETFAELFAKTNSKEFEEAHFLSSLLEKGSMWISGRDRMRNNVLWHVQVPDFKVLLKKTIEHLHTYLPTIMVSCGSRILFANKRRQGDLWLQHSNSIFSKQCSVMTVFKLMPCVAMKTTCISSKRNILTPFKFWTQSTSQQAIYQLGLEGIGLIIQSMK